MCISSPPPPRDMTRLEQQNDMLFDTQREQLSFMIRGNVNMIGWRDFKPKSTCEWADSPRKICVTANTTLKKAIQPDEK